MLRRRVKIRANEADERDWGYVPLSEWSDLSELSKNRGKLTDQLRVSGRNE